jgi:hypothetical protein
MDALLEFIPAASKVNIFNLYGGYLALNLADKDRIVIANTNRYVVFEFWKCFLEGPDKIASISADLHARKAIDSRSIDFIQRSWAYWPNPYLRAALFFLLNNYAKRGGASTGEVTTMELSPFALRSLQQLQVSNLYLNFYDKNDILDFDFDQLKTDFVIFPVGKFSYNIFEHAKATGIETASINHNQLRTFLKATKNQTLLIYTMHPHLNEFYKDFEILYVDVYGKPTQTPSKAREALIANFGIN